MAKWKLWLERHGKTAVETGKNVLIAGLLLSAILLSAKAGVIGGRDLLPELTQMFRGTDSGTIGTLTRRDYAEAAQPLVISVSPERGTRYGVMFSSETETVYDRFSTYLGEAVGSAGKPEVVSQKSWQTALSGEGVFFDFVQSQDLLCVAAWLGTSAPENLAGLTAQQLFLSVEENRVLLYFTSGNGQTVYCCSTALAKSALETRMQSYTSNQAIFAFESSQYSALEPVCLVIPGNQEIRSISAAASAVPENRTELLRVFGMNSVTATSYTENDGGKVYLDGDATLRLDAKDGVNFERSESGSKSDPGPWNGGASLPDVVDALYQTTQRLMTDTGDAVIRLTAASYDSAAETYTVCFGYYLDGMPICLERGYAAEYTVTSGKITRAQLRLRQYQLTGETEVSLSGPQAAALVCADGGRKLVRVYQDNGETLSVAWRITPLWSKQ